VMDPVSQQPFGQGNLGLRACDLYLSYVGTGRTSWICFHAASARPAPMK